MIAEDVNVCFPLTYWTTIAEVPPDRGDKTSQTIPPAAPVSVDATHVWCPGNTEYEIFKVGEKKHTLGAFLILNHRTPFKQPCLPLEAIAKQAHDEALSLTWKNTTGNGPRLSRRRCQWICSSWQTTTIGESDSELRIGGCLPPIG